MGGREVWEGGWREREEVEVKMLEGGGGGVGGRREREGRR